MLLAVKNAELEQWHLNEPAVLITHYFAYKENQKFSVYVIFPKAVLRTLYTMVPDILG